MNICGAGTNFRHSVGSAYHSVRQSAILHCSSLHRISRLEPVR
jgi:hypothetical protein